MVQNKYNKSYLSKIVFTFFYLSGHILTIFYMDNNFLNTWLNFFQHLTHKSREIRYHRSFCINTGFVNIFAQFYLVWTFLRSTPLPSITYLTKWYFISMVDKLYTQNNSYITHCRLQRYITYLWCLWDPTNSKYE